MAERARSDEAAGGEPRRKGLGTFAGVFTPSILTILGLVLFLRLGFVTGAGGLTRALLILALANSISVLTTISLSAIATNFEVKGGGDYYLISRTLGPQFGGAIGIVLFLAQSISVAFYAIGFGEAVSVMIGVENGHAPWLAGAALAALFALAWLGADWATRFQFGIMAFLGSALVAFAVGAWAEWRPETLAANWTGTGDVPFWALFAIFFPAVTGFTQGVSMSGDLTNPSRSLPLGTFLAVGVSIVVYFGCALLFAGALPAAELAEDVGAMRRLSWAPWLIDAGVIAATLSSGLASFLGAPRILQSLANDRLVPGTGPFAKTAGSSGNPRRAVLLTGLIAAATILAGDLNRVAQVVTMFFLTSYCLLNYATYFEARTNSPSFRPTFRLYRERLSLLGCLACVGAIVAIQPTAGALAFALLMGIHHFLGRRSAPRRFADSSRSYLFQRVRERLHAMEEVEEHARDWRPVIVAVSDDPGRRERIVRFASWIEGGSGLTTAVTMLEGEGAQMRRRREEAEAELARDIHERGLAAFARVVLSPDAAVAFPTLLQSMGLGAIRPNTVLLNWFDRKPGEGDPPGLVGYGKAMRTALRLGCNLILFEATLAEMKALESTPAGRRRIDVWWRADASSRLAILLAYLMTRTQVWEDARIRLVAPIDERDDVERAAQELEQMLTEVRIEAEPHVLPFSERASLFSGSADASIVLLPFRLHDEEPLDLFGNAFGESLDELPAIALVLAAGDVELDSHPDLGPQAELAAAQQRAAEAQERARGAQGDAEASAASLEAARAEHQAALDAGVDGDAIAALERRIGEAEEAAERDRRRAAKAAAKAQEADREAGSVESEAPAEKGEGAPP